MIRSKGPEETEAFARSVAREVLTKGPRNEAVLVLLQGDLGAGKTAFAKGFAKELGVEESVTSPTFVIEKVYTLTKQAFARLVHIDAYRLDANDTLHAIDFESRLKDPTNIILLEWPDQVAYVFPDSALRLRFSHVSETERDITYAEAKN